MGSRILLDTSVLIHAQRGHSSTQKSLLNNARRLCISRVVACEIVLGSRTKEELKVNREMLDRISILEINEEISRLSFYFIEKYGLKQKLYVPDALIIATASVYGIPVWTLNIRHFKHVKEIELFTE